MDSVSVKVHQITVVYMSNNDSVWVDGEEVNVTVENRKRISIEGGCKFVIHRPEQFVIRLVVNPLGFVVRIRRHSFYTRYIAVARIKLGTDYCCSSPPMGGICGGCMDCSSFSHNLPCAMDLATTTQTTPLTITTTATNGTTETSLSTTSTMASTTMHIAEEGGIFDPNKIIPGGSIVESEGIDTTLVAGIGPGNTVCNNDASMITENVQIFNSQYVSIEFFVKTCHDPKCYGTILSYTSEKTFAIKNYYGKVVITYGDMKYEPDLSLEDNKWSQIALVYDGNSYLDIYVFDSNGAYTRDLIELEGTNPFSGKGRLALGKWQPPPDGSEDQPISEGFEGCIDELRIWER